MKSKLIPRQESGSNIKSPKLNTVKKDQNIRPVPSIITKPRDKKKNIGIPKMIGI